MQEISFPSDLLTVSKFCCALYQVSQTLLSLGTAMPRCRKRNPASSRVPIKYLEMLFWNVAGWIHHDCWLNIWDLKNVFQGHIPSVQTEVDEYSSASGYLLESLLNHASICHTYLCFPFSQVVLLLHFSPQGKQKKNCLHHQSLVR